MSMIDMGPIEYFLSFWRIIELLAIGAGIAAQFIYMSQRSYTGTDSINTQMVFQIDAGQVALWRYDI